jgi:sortase A
MNRSTRLITIGVLLLLLVAVRMVTASSNSSSGVELSEMDADQLQQTLTAQVSPTIPQPFVASSATRTPLPTNETQPLAVQPAAAGPSLSQTDIPSSNSSGANNVQPDGFLAPAQAQRTAPADTAGAPVRIIIPAIALDAPVTKAKYRKILLQGDVFDQWVAPDQFAAGWIATSAFFGENGNTVLVGHHNEYGEVFGRLIDLNVGDTIVLFSAASSRAYKVTNKMILQELDVPVAQRIQNARWIGRSNDERLTLVTCWPKETNSHRLIIVASPN